MKTAVISVLILAVIVPAGRFVYPVDRGRVNRPVYCLPAVNLRTGEAWRCGR